MNTRPAEERFWDKVAMIPEHACWEWTASKNKAGYGQFRIGGKTVKAHRFSYELVKGPVPDGLYACHKCDNPGCVRPDHIFPGTHADNMADMARKGRWNSPRGEQHYSRTHPERLARGDRNGSRLHPESRPRGDQHGRAKLTEAQVREIRAAYAAGSVAQAELGRRYGVGQAQIWRIVRGKLWEHAPTGR